jgi:hypothetical protein
MDALDEGDGAGPNPALGAPFLTRAQGDEEGEEVSTPRMLMMILRMIVIVGATIRRFQAYAGSQSPFRHLIIIMLRPALSGV